MFLSYLLVVVIYSFQKVVKTMTFYIWCFSPARDDDDDDDEVVVVIVVAFVILSGGASTIFCLLVKSCADVVDRDGLVVHDVDELSSSL